MIVYDIMQVSYWTLIAFISGLFVWYITDWVEFGVFIYTCFVGFGLVILFNCTPSPGGTEEQPHQGQNTQQLLLVFFFFLCTILGVFVVSVWIIYTGITTSELKENIKSKETDSAHTIVIANALIWTFALLSLFIYMFSQIGFRISEIAHRGIASAIAGSNASCNRKPSNLTPPFNDANVTFVY